MTTADLAKAGFDPPEQTYTKPDPRGREYGSYHASIVLGRIVVRFVDEYGPQYSMYFRTREDFSKWALIHT